MFDSNDGAESEIPRKQTEPKKLLGVCAFVCCERKFYVVRRPERRKEKKIEISKK